MREYKIIRSDLGWNIYRKKESWKFIHVEFLNWNGAWTTNKNYARTFYNREDAISALTIMRAKDGKESD